MSSRNVIHVSAETDELVTTACSEMYNDITHEEIDEIASLREIVSDLNKPKMITYTVG